MRTGLPVAGKPENIAQPEPYRFETNLTSFRTFQARPKDLPALPRQPECAVRMALQTVSGREGAACVHVRRREFITLLGGAAARGRWRRARSSPSGCGASACS